MDEALLIVVYNLAEFVNKVPSCSLAGLLLNQAVEAADKGLTDSQSNENEACQLQQDNKGFAFDATGTYKLDFDCDHSVDGNCAAALKTYQETVLQRSFR